MAVTLNTASSPFVTVRLTGSAIISGKRKTVTVWLQVAVLVQGSAACHVRVAVNSSPVPLVTVLSTERSISGDGVTGESKVQLSLEDTNLSGAQVSAGT